MVERFFYFLVLSTLIVAITPNTKPSANDEMIAIKSYIPISRTSRKSGGIFHLSSFPSELM